MPAHADGHAHLMSTIREDVIPRLIVVHLTPPAGEYPHDAALPTRIPPREEEIAELARIAALGDLRGALAFIERLLVEGLSTETVLLNLVRPAARSLDEDWESNGWTFDRAMAGLDTLEQVVRVLVKLVSASS